MDDLLALIGNLEEVPEAFRKYYKKVEDSSSPFNGKYMLRVKSVEGLQLDNAELLKNTLAKVRQAHRGFEELGLSIDDIREALSDQKKLKELNVDEKVQASVEAREKEFKKKHAADVDGFKTTIANLTSERDGALIGSSVSDAMTKHGALGILRPHIQGRIRVVHEGGKPVVRVVNEDGTPMTTRVVGKQDPMTIDEFVASLKEIPDYAPGFKPTGAAGMGGSVGGSTSGNGKTRDGTSNSRQTRDGVDESDGDEGYRPGTAVQRLRAKRLEEANS